MSSEDDRMVRMGYGAVGQSINQKIFGYEVRE